MQSKVHSLEVLRQKAEVQAARPAAQCMQLYGLWLTNKLGGNIATVLEEVKRDFAELGLEIKATNDRTIEITDYNLYHLNRDQSGGATRKRTTSRDRRTRPALVLLRIFGSTQPQSPQMSRCGKSTSSSGRAIGWTAWRAPAPRTRATWRRRVRAAWRCSSTASRSARERGPRRLHVVCSLLED